MSPWAIFAYGIKRSVRRPRSVFVTLVILIVPVLYPLIWLQAFWNPYANIGNLPVAFVNEDAGQIGASLEQQLRTSTDVDWQFPSRSDADAGLLDATYYAEIIVPSDFSASVTALTPGTIQMVVDSKNNFAATLLVTQIQEGVRSSLAATISQSTLSKALPDQDKLTAFVLDPVQSNQIDLSPVPNMGTGFAPYFSSLALWIGAMMISLVIAKRVDRHNFIGSPGANIAIGQYLVYAFIGALQAALLTGVLAWLGIDIQHPLATFGALLVSSMTSIALVCVLISVLGMLGQMLSMVLLILQLTASSGTYPIQLTQGGFFQALHPYVPFTYSVKALRETVSAPHMDLGVVFSSIGIQLGVAVVLVAISALVTHWFVKRTSEGKSIPLQSSGPVIIPAGPPKASTPDDSATVMGDAMYSHIAHPQQLNKT